MTAGLAERAAAVVDSLPDPPTPEAVLAAQDEVEALAEKAKGDDLAGVQDAGHMLAMIADFVLDPAAASPEAVLAGAWREEEHPRVPGGEHGGEFTHAPGGGGWESMLDDPLLDDVERGIANHDHVLEALAARTGFDAKPDVVSDAGLDKRVAAGEREMWRGIAAFNIGPGEGRRAQTEAWAKQFTGGDYFAGLGTLGNGTYVSHRDPADDLAAVEREFANAPRNPDGSFKDRLDQRIYDRMVARAHGLAREQAAGYAGGGTVMRMTLDKGARTTTSTDLLAKWAERLAEVQARREADPRAEREYQLIKDFGRFAITQGYDAVDLSHTLPGEWLILNRGALHVSSRFLTQEEAEAR